MQLAIRSLTDMGRPGLVPGTRELLESIGGTHVEIVEDVD